MSIKTKVLVALSVTAFFSSGLGAAENFDLGTRAKSARQTLSALVEANTTNPPGNEMKAVEIIARRLDEASISYDIFEFGKDRQNLVARLKGEDSGLKPVMLLAHLDVVGAEGQSWSVDPHKVTEKDGYLYGRGVFDDLGMAVVNLETFIWLKKSGAHLKRDVILAYTGDEESGGAGIRDLLKKDPAALAAGIAFNETGGVILDGNGKVSSVTLQSAEKIYQDFVIGAHGSTGHSSVPLPDNAIYRLARGLARLSAFHFPARLTSVTRAYFEERSRMEPPKVAAAMRAILRAKAELPAAALKVLEADPITNAKLRTTCVATVVSGGTRVNALPASAQASVNCRILPGEDVEIVRQKLEKVLGDSELSISILAEFGKSAASPLDDPDLAVTRQVIQKQWPGVPIIPVLSLGATDSRFLRPTGVHAYGLNPIGMTEADSRRAHGVDERIPVGGLETGIEFFDRLIRALAVQ